MTSPDPGEVRAGEPRRQAAGPMEARGELDPGRESAGGDLLLALLARREDLRRGGCPRGAAAPGSADPERPGGAGARRLRREWARGPGHGPPGRRSGELASGPPELRGEWCWRCTARAAWGALGAQSWFRKPPS